MTAHSGGRLSDNRGMDIGHPRPAAGTTAAEWLLSRIDAFAEHWVTGNVGPGFGAYARIFHPLDDGPDALRWADVAASHGRTMHASAQWEHIGGSMDSKEPPGPSSPSSRCMTVDGATFTPSTSSSPCRRR